MERLVRHELFFFKYIPANDSHRKGKEEMREGRRPLLCYSKRIRRNMESKQGHLTSCCPGLGIREGSIS